jgi:hypothetical protein
MIDASSTMAALMAFGVLGVAATIAFVLKSAQ